MNVSILIPALNEADYIASAIASIAAGAVGIDYEIIVLDGGSHDRTCDIVAELAGRDRRIRLEKNPRRLQSAALNIGARLCDPKTEVLIRADSHALYPPGFVEMCVRKLREKAAVSVVVTMQTLGRHAFQKGVAATQNSRLGNGGSAHRRPGPSRYIDHGHHAAFDRTAFLAVGGYDETLAANEDVELDARLIQAGGQIWLETSMPIIYYPRDTACGLARQYFRYGRGRATTFLRHRYRLKLRQLAPVFVLISNATAVTAALLISPWFLAIPSLYVLLCFTWGICQAIVDREPSLAATMAPAAIIMHHMWGAGFMVGLTR